MIDIALNYSERLIKAFRNTWFVDKYKFYNTDRNYFKLAKNTCYRREFISLDRVDDKLIGFISYDIDRYTNSVVNFSIINFTDNITDEFDDDCLKILLDIFDKFHFHKMSFYIVVGNPVEAKYDKLVKMLGGRVVGYKKDEVKLYDNKYYDCKFYEILENDYLERKQRKWQLSIR